MSGSPAEVHQLMGEVLYVHYLLLHPNEQALRRVLGWSSPPVDIPPELVDGLRFQFINIGVGMALIPFQVGTLIETGEQWKELEPVERDRLLDDPWAFKEFLFSRRFTSQLLANNQNTGGLERHLLLHIAFPDTFERILQNDKNRIAGASRFARFVGEETDDVDRKMQQIRQGMEAERDGDLDFYADDVVGLWRNSPPPAGGALGPVCQKGPGVCGHGPSGNRGDRLQARHRREARGSEGGRAWECRRLGRSGQTRHRRQSRLQHSPGEIPGLDR